MYKPKFYRGTLIPNHKNSKTKLTSFLSITKDNLGKNSRCL